MCGGTALPTAGPAPLCAPQPRKATSVPQRATGSSQPRPWRRSRHNRLGKLEKLHGPEPTFSAPGGGSEPRIPFVCILACVGEQAAENNQETAKGARQSHGDGLRLCAGAEWFLAVAVPSNRRVPGFISLQVEVGQQKHVYLSTKQHLDGCMSKFLPELGGPDSDGAGVDVRWLWGGVSRYSALVQRGGGG